MPGLVPGIHVFADAQTKKGVDGRDKPGHDACGKSGSSYASASARLAALANFLITRLRLSLDKWSMNSTPLR
jgi:hypothetical protein